MYLFFELEQALSLSKAFQEFHLLHLCLQKAPILLHIHHSSPWTTKKHVSCRHFYEGI